MKRLFIPKTDISPLVDFNPTENFFLLEGASYPEDPIIIYKQMMDFSNEYINLKPQSLRFDVKVSYFNTASSKLFLQLLKFLSKHIENLTINWFYEEDDEDIRDFGDDLKTFIPANIILIPILT
jgi:hypothetical protein